MYTAEMDRSGWDMLIVTKQQDCKEILVQRWQSSSTGVGRVALLASDDSGQFNKSKKVPHISAIYILELCTFFSKITYIEEKTQANFQETNQFESEDNENTELLYKGLLPSNIWVIFHSYLLKIQNWYVQ